jgi:hypothetical protein
MHERTQKSIEDFAELFTNHSSIKTNKCYDDVRTLILE